MGTQIMEERLIFDLGMHKAEDTEFYLKKGFRVVAIEADPELAQRASERLDSYVKAGKLQIINKAIAAATGDITFFRSKKVSDWGTINRSWADRNQRLGADIEEMTVSGVLFRELLREHGTPHYMKIDIEGADTLCLEGLLETKSRPKFVSIESAKTSFEDLFQEFALFTQLGYGKFKIIPQHKITEQVAPNPPREGVYVDHKFSMGSSGTFGLELPGEWLSLEEAIKRYIAIFRMYRLTGDAGKLSSNKFVRQTINSSRTGTSLAGTLVRRVLKPIGSRMGLRPGWYDTHAMYTNEV
jgi:FkbM family methyltransferase